MNWVEEFYLKQEAWSGIYTSGVSDYNRQKALKLQWMAGAPPRSVLELGAGGGQNAYAVAELGYEVTAIELLEKPAFHGAELEQSVKKGSMKVMHGDFYNIDLVGAYDVVCYWDGFGIGEDSDQIRILRRIAQWLKDDGVGLLDIYSPWYWAKIAGREMSLGVVNRRYEFDAFASRMIDRWWQDGHENDGVAQSLRCYSPADLKLLLRGTGLVLADNGIVPGGMVDYDNGTYVEDTSLEQCMQYTVKLVKA